MYRYCKEFKNWTCRDDERISITHIEANGRYLEEMLDNCHISFEDWHGNEVRWHWSVWDLSTKDYEEVVRLISTHLIDTDLNKFESHFGM